MTYPEAAMLQRNDIITVKRDRHQEVVDHLDVRPGQRLVIIHCKSGNIYKHTLVEINKNKLAKSGGGRRETTRDLQCGQIWLARIQYLKPTPKQLAVVQLMSTADPKNLRIRILDGDAPFEQLSTDKLYMFDLLQFIKD